MQYILGLIPMLGWGTGDVFGTYASRKIGSYNTTFYSFFFGIILTSLGLPFFWGDVYKITLPLLLLNIVLGAFYVLGNFLLNEGFKEDNASVVGTIMQSFAAIVLILSALIFGDKVNWLQIIWIVLVFAGVFLLSLNLKDIKAQKKLLNRGVKFGLAAMVIFAIYFTFFRLFSNQYGWFLPNYISFLTLPIGMFVGRRFVSGTTKIHMIKDPKMVLATLLNAFLLRSGDLAMNLGLSLGFAAIVSPMAASALLVFVVLSTVVFRDKISRQQILGIVVAVVGLLGLGFSDYILSMFSQ